MPEVWLRSCCTDTCCARLRIESRIDSSLSTPWPHADSAARPGIVERFDKGIDQSRDGVLLRFDMHGETELLQRCRSHRPNRSELDAIDPCVVRAPPAARPLITDGCLW